MFKDKIFKIICIVCLVSIALFSLFKNTHIFLLLISLSAVYFTCVFTFVVQGSVYLVSTVRGSNISNNSFVRLGIAILCNSLFTAVCVLGASVLWQALFLKQITLTPVYTVAGTCAIVVTFFSLLCEILFLTREREIDNRVVKNLDNELMHAEVKILKNELDPHFVYNSLMPLYYLIKNDVSKAESFAYKLMQVYQHFLQKRQDDFVTLEEEIDFIKNYYYLLQIRFKDALVLNVNIEPAAMKMQVIPFSLQLLVENAIKHNQFSKEAPLQIDVRNAGNFIVVSNSYRAHLHEIKTSKVGLNNLRTRYKILSDRTITVLKNKDLFVVKIPLLRNASSYDVNSYNRG